MTKKYFETPSIKLGRLTADVIATSVDINNSTGNGVPQAPGRAGAPHRSIWD